MQQPTLEIDAFVTRVDALPAGPDVSLDAALQPALDEEAELRKLFATDKTNSRLANPYVGLVDLFAAPATLRTTRARVVKDAEDLSAKYVMPISENERRPEGAPSTVVDLDEFRKNWSIFTEGSLSQLFDWNNVVAAGGSVLACLTPLDEQDKVSKRAIRKVYHSKAYPTSDIDLFLWGLTTEQAEAKIKVIYEAVRDSVPWDVTCIRTKHTVSIHSQYPYRSVQIVLRLYQSPAEILAGFDIDAPCCAYDGKRIWANPRAVVAMMRQCNTVDITRRSPSYEVRLSKYSRRNFEVYVSNLERQKIDPTIYERSIARMEGLARLLVLEKLTDDNLRNSFLEGRRQLRGRQQAISRYNRRSKRKYKGDLKAETGSGIEINDYDVASLHIPYGPGWDARRIDKLVYQTDLGMNSTFNPKNKGRRLHRHPAFFGTIEECMEDCCESCPDPIDEDEKQLQAEEDEHYIRGRIQFMQENPGRQSMTGSFNPIDDGEWSEQVYIKSTQQLFAAIATHDRETVKQLLNSDEIDVNDRDHVGRTSLHIAIISKAIDIAIDLIDAGARITARLADGRAPLHLAAQYNLIPIIKKLFEKSKANEAGLKKNTPDNDDEDSMNSDDVVKSSEDDWSSHDDEDVEMSDADDEGENEDEDEDKKPKVKTQEESNEGNMDDLQEDKEDQPDIIITDEPDWDFGLSALGYAILFGTIPTVESFLEAGADVKAVMKSSNGMSLHPLTLTIVREDEDEACKIAECLLKAGASSSTANENMITIFHAAIQTGRTKLVETFLRSDPHIATIINFPALIHRHVAFPISTAINKHHYGIVALLLAYDAKLDFAEEDITRAQDAAKPEIRRSLTMYGGVENYVHLAYQPLETAIKNTDDLAKLLIALGAPVNVGIMNGLAKYSSPHDRLTIKDWVDAAHDALEYQLKKTDEEDQVVVDATMLESEEEDQKPTSGWKAFHANYRENLNRVNISGAVHFSVDNSTKESNERMARQRREYLKDAKEFLNELQGHLSEKNAKKWEEVYPDTETTELKSFQGTYRLGGNISEPVRKERTYVLLNTTYDPQNVPKHLVDGYDQLYEACCAGDNETIERLCLPQDENATIANLKSTPLTISVLMKDPGVGRYDNTGYTPLFAAIAGRQWSTAKLILAIATAQYHPANEKDRIKFNVDIEMDSDSDNESDDSEGSVATVEEKEIKFVDIATRSSAIQSPVHPSTMLVKVSNWWRTPAGAKEDSKVTIHLLSQAVCEHDLDAFIHIADLYQTLPNPVEIPSDVLMTILRHDVPDILHEYIKRTGVGVNLQDARKEDDPEVPVIVNDKNKVYLGLNVHGKKRADLARKNDPDATDDKSFRQAPLVWQAACQKAKEILKYLTTNKPMAAYKHYSMSSSTGVSLWLRRILGKKSPLSAPEDLQEKVATWLGWSINAIGESPLIAGILSGDLDTIKLLSKLKPDLFSRCLQTRFKFIGVNALFYAIRLQSKNKILDYLLSRNLSPVEKDSFKSWNIYHHICDMNAGRLLEYFLEKLPTDVNENLLAQQSKPKLNTPLHIAIKKGNKDLVKILLAYSKTNLLTRDVDGQTPLHCAVKLTLADITSQIIVASPSQALFMEDAVGNTPIEGIRLMNLTQQYNHYRQTGDASFHYSIPQLNSTSGIDVPTYYHYNQTINVFKGADPVKLSEMKEIVERLAQDEKMRFKIQADVILKWIAQAEKKAEALNDKKKKWEKEQEEINERNKIKVKTEDNKAYSVESGNLTKTYKVVQDALEALGPNGVESRHLIHVLDVQVSVNATLTKVAGKEDDDDDDGNSYYNRRSYRLRRLAKRGVEGELDPEEDENKAAWKTSFYLNTFPKGGDNL